MADGLLLTRRERVRLYWQKFGLGYGPSALLGVVALALGGGGVGWVILIFGALLGLFVASSARKVRGAAIGGVVCAVVLFLFQLVIAWFVTHEWFGPQ
jgi:O-antigen ligase